MMKNLCLALAAAALCAPALAGTDVGVSVGISQPGFYGRIDIGSVAAPPVLVYPQPVVIARPPTVVVQQRPVYLRVPPGHAKHWQKHCAEYGACAQPVYFVQEDWYQRYYAAPPGNGKGKGNSNSKGNGNGKHG
jgi:hypothetical protein